MRKRYFLITFAIITIIAGVWVWACKHPFGPGISGMSDVINGGGVPAKGWYMNESGGPGYKGEILYGTNVMIPSKQSKYGGGQVYPKNSGNNYYRIPTLVVATNGDLLAFADRRKGGVGDLPNQIEIVVKRSTDNGTNWLAEELVSPISTSKEISYGDAGVVLDRKTGNIIIVCASGPGFLAPSDKQPLGSTDKNPIRINIIKGRDNGKIWEQPKDITAQIYGVNCKDPERKTWHGAFATSGNGVQLRNGRILFVLSVRKSEANSPLYNHVIYSDDGGDTWKVSKGAPDISKNPNRGGGEAKIVELNDGTLLMSIRPEGNEANFKRFFAKSTDNGNTWSVAEPKNDFPSSSSNGDIIYYTSVLNGWDKDRIVSMVDSLAYTASTPPGKPFLRISYDEGNTWEGLQVFNGSAGYSSLAILPDGSIGILAELYNSWSGPIYFMRANLKWLNTNDSGPTRQLDGN